MKKNGKKQKAKSTLTGKSPKQSTKAKLNSSVKHSVSRTKKRDTLLKQVRDLKNIKETQLIKRKIGIALDAIDTRGKTLGNQYDPKRADQIQINDIPIEDVQKISEIIRKIPKQIQAQIDEYGFPKFHLSVYENAAAKINEVIAPYRKAPIRNRPER